MGIRQFITCYNLCCFILSKKRPKYFSFISWSTPILRLSVVSYKHKNIQNISECLLFTGRPWGDDYQSVYCRHLTIQETTKKTLINKLSENVSGYVHIVLRALCVSFSWTVQTLHLQYFCSLFTCLLWFFY